MGNHAMTKEEYGNLLAEIGGDPVGLPSSLERGEAEQEVFARQNLEFQGLLLLGDAMHQFYRDTLEVIRRSLKPSMTETQIAMVNWHVVSFGRFAAAYHLAVHGYYFETMALARDLWEVALALSALKRNVVTIQELATAGANTARQMGRMSQDVDRKIRAALLNRSNNVTLSADAEDAVETFLVIANTAMHKSKLHMSLNLAAWWKGSAVQFFPHFDSERATAAFNVLFQALWCLLSTLPYLDFALPGSDPRWLNIYEKVQLALLEGLGSGPKK